MMGCFSCAILILLLLAIFNFNVFSLPTPRAIEPETYRNVDSDPLLLAHVIYRHGDRNIDQIYPNDPYKDEIHWPGGIGELTNEGKMRHFKLGQFLRRRYDKLLGSRYSAKNVYIQSTDVDRTIMSSLVNLAGLFPPEPEEVWNRDIFWQPIPVHTVSEENDNAYKNCPKYNVAIEKYVNESPEVQRVYTEFADLFAYWSKMCGRNITTTSDVYRLHNTLLVESQNNKTLADWARKAIEPNGTMECIALLDTKLWAATPELARLKPGFLLKEMLERFSHKIDKTLNPDRSLWIYSTHYYMIANMLNGLGLFEPHMPPYASSLHFELYKTEGNEHYIQLFYRRFEEEELSPFNIPRCGEKCPIHQFYEKYSEIIPGDFESECQLPQL